MKNPNLLLTGMLACSLLFFNACKKGPGTPATGGTGNPDADELLSMNVPAGFNYETSKNVVLDITILAPDNSPVRNIPIEFLNKSAELGGVVLAKQITDNNGKISGTIKLPALVNEVVIDAKYLGVIRNAAVGISSGKLLCTLGGSEGYAGNVIVNSPLTGGRPGKGQPALLQKPLAAYRFMGGFDNQGKPNYLEPVNETISAAFLADINASLPEGRPVATYHPDYLSNNVETNANITALSDVWFTFITEGAGYKNSIAYFTYPTNNPPQTPAAIDSLHIILPNASLTGSGGSLKIGNTVKLGRFNAGTSVGFALIANGWNGTTVGNGSWIVYSLDHLNPQTNSAIKRQSVFLYDNAQELFLVGFEDIRRDNSGCDNDFNDCLFYVKSNPVTAISKSRVNPVDRPVDTDGDGVNDVYDDFPNDPTRAYIHYYPGENTTGTVAFEDNWPYLGDYDLNDLVVDYRYAITSDALNRAVSMKAKYVLKASGASFKNGFGVEFPFASTLVQHATGSLVKNTNIVTLGSNGCETGQTRAVIIPFDDAFAAMNMNGGFINTNMNNPRITRDTIVMDISFTRPLTPAEMGNAPYNPFIIVNRERGREVHLPGNAATAKINTQFYKKGVDNTDASQGRHFKTNTGLPWAIDFVENFDYPVEGKSINAVFTKFIPWVEAGGSSNANWYKDSANTIKSFIYKK